MADVVGYGRAAATDGDGTSFHVIQGIITETAVRPDAVPGFGLRVVFFATVRVDDDRKVRRPFQFADKAGNVFRLRAVDADGLQVRIVTGQLAGTIGQELAFAVVAAVAAGKADPIGGRPVLRRSALRLPLPSGPVPFQRAGRRHRPATGVPPGGDGSPAAYRH